MQTWASRLSCPRCRTLLFAARKEGVRVDACGGCGGVWLATADARIMLDRKSTAPAELAHVAASHARTLAVRPGPIACLECGEEMARSLVPDASVEIDACAVHGTWFDRGELERVTGALLPKSAVTPPPPVHLTTPPPVTEEEARRIAWDTYRDRKNFDQVLGDVFDMLLK